MTKSSGSVSFRSSKKSSGKKKVPREKHTEEFPFKDTFKNVPYGSDDGDEGDGRNYDNGQFDKANSEHNSAKKNSTSFQAGSEHNSAKKNSTSFQTGKNSGQKRPGPKKKSRLYGILTGIAVLIALGILVYIMMYRGFSKVEKYKLNKSDITVNNLDKNMDHYQTVALFGVDDQDNKIYDKGSRTDSIIVASINKRTKKVKLMSIYRDTLVSIDGQYDKINAAYSFGGPEQALNTINRNLDLNITDFATVNFKALADAVDILGGIELTIQSEKELDNLNDYIGNMNKINGGDSPKFKKVGTYKFDGNQAVAYSRIRYMEGGDHARAGHQRLVLEGILHEAKRQPWKINALISKVLPQCKTSFSTGELSKMAMALILYDIKDSQAYPFDSFDERYDGIYYGFPTTVESNVIKAHKYLYGTKDYKPSEELKKISEKVENRANEVSPY